MLRARQGSQLAGLQPAHSKRSASWPQWGHFLQQGPQCVWGVAHRVATQSWAADSQGAEFKARGQRVCGCPVAGQSLVAGTREASVCPRTWGYSSRIPGLPLLS